MSSALLTGTPTNGPRSCAGRRAWQGQIVGGDWAMMAGCAASTGVPRRDQRALTAATTAHERPGQGHRNPGPPAPDHAPRAATARREGPVHPRRPCVPRRAATPTAPPRAPPHPAADTSRYRAALAPRPDHPPTRGDLPPQACRAPTDRAVDPRAGATPGPREQLVGLPQNPRRTARAGHQGRRLDRLGDTPRSRHRPGTPTDIAELGGVPALPSS